MLCVRVTSCHLVRVAMLCKCEHCVASHRFDVRECCVPKPMRYEISLFYVIWISGSICRWQRQPRLVWFVFVIGRYNSNNKQTEKNAWKITIKLSFISRCSCSTVCVILIEMNDKTPNRFFKFTKDDVNQNGFSVRIHFCPRRVSIDVHECNQ